ncbi:MAG: hypothetical protein AAF682_29845 [Planctomycetota bacterium]
MLKRSLSLAVLLAAAAPVAAQSKTVETYSHGGVLAVSLPLSATESGYAVKPAEGGGLTSMSFTAGSKKFGADWVDFAGTEGSWTAATCAALDAVLIALDNGSYALRASIDGYNEELGGDATGDISASGIYLGSDFGAKCDVPVGQTIKVTTTIKDFVSKTNPCLNGSKVTLSDWNTINSVDASTGVISYSSHGSLKAVRPMEFSLASSPMAGLGIGMMIAGLLGSVIRRFRR